LLTLKASRSEWDGEEEKMKDNIGLSISGHFISHNHVRVHILFFFAEGSPVAKPLFVPTPFEFGG
jgi:hypothetical protein